MHKLSSPQGKEVHARRSYFLQSTQAVFNTSGHAPHCARHVWVRFPPDPPHHILLLAMLRVNSIFFPYRVLFFSPSGSKKSKPANGKINYIMQNARHLRYRCFGASRHAFRPYGRYVLPSILWLVRPLRVL
jgi:hypothetical protein